MIAFLAMSLASQQPIDHAVQIANLACGIVCSKLGTATVTSIEIHEHAFSKLIELDKKKILPLAELNKLISIAKKSSKTVVFTNGCFDILHFGHVDFLKKCKKQGDILIVGLNSDSSITRLKGTKRPIQNEVDRAGILAGLESVDFVVFFSDDTPIHLIETLEPHVLCKGADYNVATIVGSDVVIKAGGRIEIIPLIPNRSTSNIERHIQEKI